jgi:hypothetical protein
MIVTSRSLEFLLFLMRRRERLREALRFFAGPCSWFRVRFVSPVGFVCLGRKLCVGADEVLCAGDVAAGAANV